jgi:hypothetical protein
MGEELAKTFIEAYFTALAKSKEDLLQFYTDSSIMTYEGTHHSGTKEIGWRIEAMSFKTVSFSQHALSF